MEMKLLPERHQKTLIYLYSSDDPEHFQVGVYFDLRWPPMTQEYVGKDKRAEVEAPAATVAATVRFAPATIDYTITTAAVH